MKSSNLWLLPLLAVCCGTLHAQTTDEMKKQIASVKKSSLYLYGEATAETEQDAKDLAEEILYDEINKWAETQKKLRGAANFVLIDKKELHNTMSLPRGNMFRSFIFVKKSDIQKGDNAAIIANETPTTSTVEPVSGSTASTGVNALAQELAAYTRYTDLAAKVMEYNKAGKIKAYNYYAKLDNPALYYLALFNGNGEVQAVLTPGKPRKNVKTGQEDTTNNYPGCGAIGFMFAE